MEFQDKDIILNNYKLLFCIISYCNLNCYGCTTGCSINQNFKYKITLTDLNKNLKILQEKCQNLNEIIITGGEPLLHPEFKTICKMIREYFPKKQIIVFTNGLLLNKFNEDDLKYFQKLKIIFSISLYPDLNLCKQNYQQIKKLEKYNLAAPIYEKARPLFFKPSFSSIPKQENIKHFYYCNNKKENFFTLIDNKIFGCDQGIRFINSEKEINNNDYISITELKSEKELFLLKSKPTSMCLKCKKNIKGVGNDLIIWHTQKEINDDFLDSNKDLLDIFLYEYEKYKKLRDNNIRIQQILNDPLFDYAIRKRDKSEGYQNIINRYISGKGDICFIFDNSENINENYLKNIKNLLKQQNNIENFNIYIFCNNLSIEKEKEIYYYFAPSYNEKLNTFLLKNNNKNQGIKYFFTISFNSKFLILKQEEILSKLKNKNYIINNLQEKNNE